MRTSIWNSTQAQMCRMCAALPHQELGKMRGGGSNLRRIGGPFLQRFYRKPSLWRSQGQAMFSQIQPFSAVLAENAWQWLQTAEFGLFSQKSAKIQPNSVISAKIHQCVPPALAFGMFWPPPPFLIPISETGPKQNLDLKLSNASQRHFLSWSPLCDCIKHDKGLTSG